VRQLALELAPFGVTVNGIAPAGIRTSIADGFYDDERAVQRLVAEIPLGRIVEADEVVGLAVFLASRASDYLTGHTVCFDGGYLAH
jgi:NAD(P)-dependent dehydrogenase (short-subunit alcohol dehydrogenase family)